MTKQTTQGKNYWDFITQPIIIIRLITKYAILTNKIKNAFNNAEENIGLTHKKYD
jgi:hypothetical protein